MGLFSRTPPAAETRPRSRPSISSEAQARELRVRARRRLIGALALVLAVVIVAPMLFDTSSESPTEAMIVVPTVVAPAADAPLASTPDPGASEGGVIIAPDDTGNTRGQASLASAQTATPTQSSAPAQTSSTARPQTQQPTQPTQQTRQPPQAAATQRPSGSASSNPPAPPARDTSRAQAAQAQTPQTQTPQASTQDRTDDGSVALALLEGRTPPNVNGPAASSNFVLQVISYQTRQDAIAQRDRLVQSGVTNAYVETAQVNGQNTYRVRVGPFSNLDAAQAAQARIRALGDYQDAFVTSQ